MRQQKAAAKPNVVCHVVNMPPKLQSSVLILLKITVQSFDSNLTRFFQNQKKGSQLTPKKIFFQPSVPTWNALTFSALCSVLHVYFRRNQLDTSDWLPLGALCDPDLSTRDDIGRVSAGQKFSIPAPPLLRSPPCTSTKSACSVAFRAPAQCFWRWYNIMYIV